MIKLIKDDTVYIPVSQLLKAGFNFVFPSDSVVIDDDYGFLVSEDVFNRVLIENPELFEQNKHRFEITRVSSIGSKIDDMVRIRPLKYMFLKSLGVSDDDAVDKILLDDAVDTSQEIKTLCSGDGCFADRYVSLVSFLKENRSIIDAKLSACGLKLQFLTELHKTSAGLTCFVAGKGIFYEIYINDWDIEDFARFAVIDGSKLVIPDPDDPEDVIFDLNECLSFCDRDFSKYSVRENILWCLTNLNVSNDIQDEIVCRAGGILFSVSVSMVMKFMNKISFSTDYYLDGVVDFDKHILVPSDPRVQSE